MNDQSSATPRSLTSQFAPTGQAAEETLHAIVLGDADAIIVESEDGPRVYTLRDANEGYRQLIERISEAAIITDRAGMILYCNGRLAALVGQEGLAGQNFLELMNGAHRIAAERLLAAGCESPTTGELAVTSAEGLPIGLHVSAAPMPFDERPCVALLLTVLDDIAALKASEAALRESDLRFRVALADSPVVVFEQDLALRYTWICNPAFGYSIEDLIGRTDAEILHPATAVQVDAIKREVIETGQPIRSEMAIAAAVGAPKYFDFYMEPRRDENGRVTGIICAAIDITDGKLAEARLMAAKHEAERANNAKSRFLAAASHDLRQPLSALNLYIDVLKSRATAIERPLVDNMKDCAGNLSELLSNLLDLSKLDAGVVTPNPTSFPIADTLGSLVAVHAPEARAKGLRLRSVNSKLIAHTDAVLFQRMLGNLVANALRYTERGSVLIGCRRRHGRVWVEVWDTGIGIPGNKTSEIFEEFTQLTRATHDRGSGLGLAIIARTAALLGVEIHVRSEPGRGSMFAIEMPLGSKVCTPSIRECANRPLRIALVDDHPQMRKALADGLASAGHKVWAAASGAELLTHLAQERPDLLLADYRLAGGETGVDVIAAARAAFGDTLPAILLTGDTDPQLMHSMANCRVVVQHKPVDLDALLLCIHDVVPGGRQTPPSANPSGHDQAARCSMNSSFGTGRPM